VTHFSTMTCLALTLIGCGLVVEGFGRPASRGRFEVGAGAFLLGMVLAQVVLA
jgi:hypothetical protein